jgi:hypothetical protein
MESSSSRKKLIYMFLFFKEECMFFVFSLFTSIFFVSWCLCGNFILQNKANFLLCHLFLTGYTQSTCVLFVLYVVSKNKAKTNPIKANCMVNELVVSNVEPQSQFLPFRLSESLLKSFLLNC